MLKDITPKKVTVKQGFQVILEKQGLSRDMGSYTVTIFYGKRPTGERIYAVPVFANGQTEMVGQATGCF